MTSLFYRISHRPLTMPPRMVRNDNFVIAGRSEEKSPQQKPTAGIFYFEKDIFV